MSLARSIKRAAARRLGVKWPSRPQTFELQPDGGYRTLRPTKGWLRVSAQRHRAQQRLIALHLGVFARQMQAHGEA
jgi:hypothetical protein